MKKKFEGVLERYYRYINGGERTPKKPRTEEERKAIREYMDTHDIMLEAKENARITKEHYEDRLYCEEMARRGREAKGGIK